MTDSSTRNSQLSSRPEARQQVAGIFDPNPPHIGGPSAAKRRDSGGSGARLEIHVRLHS
jgi:hypothetical protein